MKKVKELTDAEIAAIGEGVYKLAHALLNIRIPDKIELGLLGQTIIPELKKYAFSMTKEEVMLAVRNGITKEYGDYFQFNVVSLVQFLKGYLAARSKQPVEVTTLPRIEKTNQMTEGEMIANSKLVLEELMKTYPMNRSVTPLKARIALKYLKHMKYVEVEDIEVRRALMNRSKEILNLKRAGISEAEQRRRGMKPIDEGDIKNQMRVIVVEDYLKEQLGIK